MTFSEQINGADDPSRLLYATNKTGEWKIETALNYYAGSRDDAGWFPSLCLDNMGTPYISCMYIKRVYTHSAVYCKLFLLTRLGYQNWHSDIIAEQDDGYYGGDGRNYTGGLTHLVIDNNNIPHIIFSDIASTHYPSPRNQSLNVGNIRYAVYKDGAWNITTIYHQPLPIVFFDATEMHGMCLIVSDNHDTIHIIGEEMVITGEYQYSSKLVSFSWENINNIASNNATFYFLLYQNYPNPFNPTTKISYQIPERSFVKIKIYDVLGNEVSTLVNVEKPAGSYEIEFYANELPSGIYFYKLNAGSFVQTKKMSLVK